MTSYISEKLTSFALDTRSFPPEVLDEAKKLILDQLGCQIAAASFAWGAAYLEAIRALGAGDGATVVSFGDRLPLDQAVFMNSTLGHGAEYDDTQLASANHCGAVCVPPGLALGEQRGLPGRQVLEGIIVGVEIGIRVGEATLPHMFNRGHHVPPAAGPFGSAATSAA